MKKAIIPTLAILLMVFIAILGIWVQSLQRSPENYAEAVSEWLARYTCEFLIVSPGMGADIVDEKGRAIEAPASYLCQTKDERQIEFNVRCRESYNDTGLFRNTPFKKITVYDNFHEAVDSYVSLSCGTIVINGMDIDAIADRIYEIMSSADGIYKEYNLTDYTPAVTFTLIQEDKTIDFVCSTMDRKTIKQRLGLIL